MGLLSRAKSAEGEERMRKKLIQKICDFGLWVLSLGPKGPEERQIERDLIQEWRKAR